MAKSYKLVITEKFDSTSFDKQPLSLTKQMHIAGTVPGPQTLIRPSVIAANVDDFRAYTIDHEYPVRMEGRLFDEGGPSFNKFIAQSKIMGYESRTKQLLLLNGKKADILDFCKRTSDIEQIDIKLIQIDMAKLQEKLPQVNGVWFRCRKGYIRAKAFMGSQIQDTQEFKAAKAEGDISTLSFYFEDPRDSVLHPIMITEDGAIVLQGRYKDIDEEIGFVLQVKYALLDGIFESVPIGKSKKSVSNMNSGEY